jgi:cob(I)alamin adenosyltransferase
MTRSRIYTQTEDDGTAGLPYGGRVSNGDELVGGCGDIDEAVSALGAARAAELEPRLSEIVLPLQRDLLVVAAAWRPARGGAAAWSPGSPWSPSV